MPDKSKCQGHLTRIQRIGNFRRLLSQASTTSRPGQRRRNLHPGRNACELFTVRRKKLIGIVPAGQHCGVLRGARLRHLPPPPPPAQVQGQTELGIWQWTLARDKRGSWVISALPSTPVPICGVPCPFAPHESIARQLDKVSGRFTCRLRNSGGSIRTPHGLRDRPSMDLGSEFVEVGQPP